jgi:hypothetical protein
LQRRVDCPTCGAAFCAACGAAPHYALQCDEVEPARARWFEWVATGRADYLRKLRREEEARAAESAATAAAAAAGVAAAAARREELVRDEAWKAERLRLCPHCQRPVEKVDGCDSMICGRDAEDKGGGNRQVRTCSPGQGGKGLKVAKPAATWNQGVYLAHATARYT